MNRGREWGRWHHAKDEPEALVFITDDGEERYWISLDRCISPAACAGWLDQVSRKRWATSEDVGDLVRAMRGLGLLYESVGREEEERKRARLKSRKAEGHEWQWNDALRAGRGAHQCVRCHWQTQGFDSSKETDPDLLDCGWREYREADGMPWQRAEPPPCGTTGNE